MIERITLVGDRHEFTGSDDGHGTVTQTTRSGLITGILQQLNDWLQKHERGAFRIDDQVERPFRPSVIRVVNQSVAECEV